ncbi:MAG: DNA-3-methyladenine glycosylase I [bacterium]
MSRRLRTEFIALSNPDLLGVLGGSKLRCEWSGSDPLMIAYHDTEWGIPVHDDLKHYEYLVLDGAQAGLSWRTVLHKRENFRRAFANFDPVRVARFTQKDIRRLLNDAGIIRNRLKIEASVTNARQLLNMQDEFGSFDQFIWQFTYGRTIHHEFRALRDLPSQSKESDAMSKALRERGFKFVGSTICYAYMQAAGMVNDHLVHCFRYKDLTAKSAKKRRSTERHDSKHP